MQAWALQQVLKGMGHEPVTIDRRLPTKGLGYRAARVLYRSLRHMAGSSVGPIFPEHAYTKITAGSYRFIKDNIVLSTRIESTAELASHFENEDYKAVVVGSDQTWRPRYSPDIFNYFLDFLKSSPIIKIAYASSFGVDTWEFSPEQTARCRDLSTQFCFIGVRESSGVELCREHLGAVAHHVLDPTLLLTAPDYLALLRKHGTDTSKRGGLYTYLLDKTPAKVAYATRLSEALQVDTFSHQPKRSFNHWEGGSLDDYVLPPLTDWLSGFARSDYVLTDSFHGMVFSIIFGKPFKVISNPGRGSARFESLLRELGLLSHLTSDSVLSAATVDPESMGFSVDDCNHKLELMRRYSLDLISVNLSSPLGTARN